MKKVIKPKITYKYVGDESPEKKKEAEEMARRFYFNLFDQVSRKIRDKKRVK